MKKKEKSILEKKFQEMIQQWLKEHKSKDTVKAEKAIKKVILRALKKLYKMKMLAKAKEKKAKKAAATKKKTLSSSKAALTYKNVKTAAAKKSTGK